MTRLSDFVAEYLKEVYKIDRVFLVSGGGAMFLNDSFGQNIPYTAFHHEQACSFAAEGYARVNQQLAVVNVTTGPGGLNCLNGLFGQWTDSVPVLYISGQVKTTTMLESYSNINLRQLGDQEVDIISVVKPLTKYCVTITNPNEIKYHIDKAIHYATTGRKGPVWLNIPIDIQSADINETELLSFVPDKIEQNEPDIDKVIDLLKSAERPLIVAGHGVRLAEQVEIFQKLINKTQLPVVTTLNGFDCINSDNPSYIGRIGTIGQRAANFVLQNADVILFLGTRNNIRQVSYNWETFAQSAYKIIVDIDEAELEKPSIKPDYPVCADLKTFLPRLTEKIDFVVSGSWLEYCNRMKEQYCFANNPEQKQEVGLIDTYHFTYKLTDCLKESDIFVMANGSATVCSFQNAIVKSGQRFILNSGNASMGFGLCAAIGAYYVADGRNVICLEGDGSIMMNLQELQTIVHNNIPIKLFVINNNGYSSIRQTQRNFFNNRMTASGVDSGVSVPDFVKVANAFGLKTKLIDSFCDIENEILDVLSSDGPILCEVKTKTEYDFIPKLSSKKLPDGRIVSPSIEDMYPFLERKEYFSCMIATNYQKSNLDL